MAQPLINVFGESPIRKIFSSTWGLREDGIAEVEDQVLSTGRPDQFTAGIGVVKETLGDKISGVVSRSIKLLTTLCNEVRPNLTEAQKRELNGNTADYILSILIEKLGDNLLKVRTAAEDALLSMVEHPGFGVKTVFASLVRSVPAKASSTTAKKTMNSNKQVIGKYSTLYRIL